MNNCLSLATEELAVVLDLDTPAIASMVREGIMEELEAYKELKKNSAGILDQSMEARAE